MLRYLLDTSICIYTIRNKPDVVRGAFRQHLGQMAISTATLMELAYGCEHSSRPRANLAVMEGFVARLEVLPYDAQAAMHTGQIRAELAGKGTPIGPYDQMIAGHARSLGLVVVSNNEREFQRVAGLRVANWVSG